ncbi:MAG: hydrogenase maturation protease [Magnetovibrio sp.]|nr:hydrogenase maturation protease [Magnetovibrio sp.]
MTDAPLIIGIGNPHRGDDGVGAAVVAGLIEKGIEAIAFDGDGMELMVLWEGQSHVIIIDATQSGVQAGTIQRFNAHEVVLPTNLFRHSTHQFGVAEAVEMARVLGELPRRLELIGVEGAVFSLGQGLSAHVKKSVATVVKSFD